MSGVKGPETFELTKKQAEYISLLIHWDLLDNPRRPAIVNRINLYDDLYGWLERKRRAKR